MKIESIRIRNYKALRDVTLTEMPSLCVFLGANGAGKSTLFDVFSFLRDALIHNVHVALAKRGGYHEVVSRNEKGPIELELKFREKNRPLVTYELHVGQDDGKSVVEREVLRYTRGKKGGRPWHFLDFRHGVGDAITNEDELEKPGAEQRRERQNLESPEILAIKGLGQFERFRAAASFRKLIENWHISDFHISDAQQIQEAGHAEHLSTRGENLPLVTQFIYERHPDVFEEILEKMSQRVPGVEKAEAEETVDGRIVLRFKDGAFADPFIARYVSDGTVKMFAYLVLLHDPSPHPLLAVEEPENQLHPDLLRELAEEFREYATRGGQVFVSTHSPDFVNGVDLSELLWLSKREGFTQISRAADDTQLRSLIDQGDLPGALWKQGLFTGAGPR